MTTAQEKRSLLDSLQYNVELQATLSGGEHTPLWLNANRYGLSSVRKNNGYLRGAIGRPLYRDSLRRWGVGYGGGSLAERSVDTWQQGVPYGTEEPGTE